MRNENFDHNKFIQWAFFRLKNGKCAIINCADYRHFDDPQISNDRCRQCFKSNFEEVTA